MEQSFELNNSEYSTPKFNPRITPIFQNNSNNNNINIKDDNNINDNNNN